MNEATSHGEHKHTKEVINRLSRIEGHVRAVKGMVEEGRACPDVLIQLAAIRSAVEQASRVVLCNAWWTFQVGSKSGAVCASISIHWHLQLTHGMAV